jgi:thiamine transporter ThiT
MVLLTVQQDDIPILEGITPEMTLILGVISTILIAAICLYAGYRKKAYEPLRSTRVIIQIAVFSALGLVLSFFAIPFILDTHISFHLLPAWLLTMSYGPFVGLVTGAIVGAKGLLTGDFTGVISNAFFCIIVGTLSLYINPEKKFRPFYMIMINVIIGSWTFGLIHMWLNFGGVVVPFLLILNLLLSMVNNILYAILVEVIIKIEQIWDPLTEESTLPWYKDDYVTPSLDEEYRKSAFLSLSLTASVYAWFAFIWLSPPFDYILALDIYNPILFVIMIVFAAILGLTSYFVYRSKQQSLVGPLTLFGSILTLPFGLLSLYAWFKYLRKPTEV